MNDARSSSMLACALAFAAFLHASGCMAEGTSDEISAEPQRVEIDGIVYVARQLEAGAGAPTVAFADLNANGNQDLVVTGSSDDHLVVFLGDGKGGLTRAGPYPAGENANHLAIADINGNGKLDVVITNHETTYLTLLYGDGRGSFEVAPNSPFTVEVQPHPHWVGAVDLDGDGHIDLIVDTPQERGVRVYRGLGKGNFESQGSLIDVGGNPYRGFALGDINGNARIDIVAPNRDHAALMVNSPGDRLAFERAESLPATSPFTVALGDFNGDGSRDVIAASDGLGSVVQVFLGDGSGGFREADQSGIQMIAGGKNIAVGDINGDGIDDALIVSWSGEVLIVLGGSEVLRPIPLQVPEIERPWGVAIADLNGNGKGDFVIADGRRPLVAVFISQSD